MKKIIAMAVAIGLSCGQAAVAKPRLFTEAEIWKAYVPFVTVADIGARSEVRHLKQPVLLEDANGPNYPSIIFDLTLTVTAERESVLTLQFASLSETPTHLSGRATLVLDDGDDIELAGQDDVSAHPRVVESASAWWRGLAHYLTAPAPFREAVGFEIECRQLAILAASRQVKVLLWSDETALTARFPKEALFALRSLRIESGCPPAAKMRPASEATRRH